jgi:hypothetical protein
MAMEGEKGLSFKVILIGDSGTRDAIQALERLR